jgi:hypothetical protein
VFLYVTADTQAATTFYVPLLKDVALPLGVMFIAVAYFWIVGFSNAVNLTDGLDGLAIMPTVLVACALGVFAYASGNAVFSTYLQIPQIPGAGELVIICAAIAGAGLGFLWFNTYPAMVFMGDIGALALGAALGTMAVIVRQELVLVVMGGVFVIETLSVMIQVASYKLTGKRVFRMAPIHHHFELKGWPEPRVIVRFWIISVVLVLVGAGDVEGALMGERGQATRLDAIEGRFDPWLLGASLALACLGVVMVASSSIAIGEGLDVGPFHFLVRHVLFLAVGLALAAWMMRTELKTVEQFDRLLLLACFVLLLLVFVPGIGRSVNGARRWLNFGIAGFQAVEAVKLM